MQTQYSTYRTLLAPVSGHGLSEAEAQDILRQILPHLITLHDRKQAHGSISLDTVAYDYDRMQIILLAANGLNHQIYLAPEVLQTQQATPTADIYAIGIVIIVLLTGFPPEALRTPNNTWNWQELCTVSDQFRQILTTALSAEPAFRYSNAGQMLQSLQPVINPSESTITSLAAPLLLPSPLLATLSTKPSSPQTPLTTELNALGSLNSGINNSHKTKKLKVNFFNSQIYRKTKTAKNQSKSNIKDLTRVFLTMLLGGGVTVSVAVGAYFYMQSKVANNGNTNVEFANSVNQSMDQAIARIDGDRKSDDDVDKLITLAKDQYESKGDLIESKRILQSIPLDSRRRAKADQLLAQWEQDLKKNNDLTQKVDKPTKDGKWQAVIDTVKGISPTPYWQSRGKEIIEEAKQKLTIPTVPASQSVAVPPANVDPPRNLTREIYNNPPTEIYTTPSETYTLPPDTYNPPTATYNPPPESSASPLPPAPRVAR
jgi:serine/threonine protein kinase